MLKHRYEWAENARPVAEGLCRLIARELARLGKHVVFGPWNEWRGVRRESAGVEVEDVKVGKIAWDIILANHPVVASLVDDFARSA